MNQPDGNVPTMTVRAADVPAGDFTIAATHPALPGHFPGRPIVPGVVLLNAAVTRIADACGATEAQRDVFEIVSAKFLSPVLPGERVEVRYLPSGAAGQSMRFTLHVAERVVASGALSLAPPDIGPNGRGSS
jgi:3-hydroxymyristoyl/3-hydroxydecanoyl-(acyl carrier protein) dehydratase